MRVFSLEQAAAEVGDDDFGDDDNGEDGQQDDCDAVPFKEVDGRVHDHADAARADQAEYGGFAHVDVPAQQHDGPEGRFDGRPVAVKNLAGLGRAGRFQGFDAAARHFFQRFAKQFADEADGAAGVCAARTLTSAGLTDTARTSTSKSRSRSSGAGSSMSSRLFSSLMGSGRLNPMAFI